MEALAENIADDTTYGVKATLHGTIFQLKVLFLFLTRGDRAGLEFELGTEMPGVAGKFDDIIFYERTNGEKRRRYLQAKHKLDENETITASDLLNESDGDFSLTKYFRSYRDISDEHKKHLKDCIIVTNIGFDVNKGDIELIGLDEKDTILDFDQNTQFKRYKINQEDGKNSKLYKKLRNNPDMRCLAKLLLAKNKLELKKDLFKRYHIALFEEKVLVRSSQDRKKGKFEENFIKGKDLKANAEKFRKILVSQSEELKLETFFEFEFELSENFGKEKNIKKYNKKQKKYSLCDDNDNDIPEFLNKLVFAVNFPNEKDLGKIITEEIGKNFNLLNGQILYNNIIMKMVEWFKDEKNIMLSEKDAKKYLEEGKQILQSSSAYFLSIDCRDYLCKKFEFNENAVNEMVEKLNPYLIPLREGREEINIVTDSPEYTAVKVIESLKRIENFTADDSYLIVESQRLNDKKKNEMKNILENEKSHYLLVIVCTDDANTNTILDNLIPDCNWKKFIIISTNIDKKILMIEDKYSYGDLSDETKKKLQSTKIQFQGSEEQVGELLDKVTDPPNSDPKSSDKLNDIIDLPTFKELSSKNIVIPFTSSLPSVFIEDQQLEIRRDDVKLDDGADQFELYFKVLARTNPALLKNIGWCPKDDNQETNWKNMKDIVEKSAEHIVGENGKSQRIIISSAAGTGKSTLLSHYVKVIKKKSPCHWVIRIDLVNHTEAIKNFVQEKAIEFLLEMPSITGKSSFAKSMLKHRLEKAGRVVLMLDGFDEISSNYQDKTIEFIKAICQTKLECLYITTRPDLKVKLEVSLLQFPFHLKNFSKQNQEDYLTATWKINLNISDRVQEQTIREFAQKCLKYLDDKARNLSEVPLYCHMLAVFYQSKLQDDMAEDPNIETDFETDNKLSLSALYSYFMKKKDQIFRDEKVKDASDADSVINTLVRRELENIATYLRGLAIKIMVDNSKEVEYLWQDSTRYQISINKWNSREKELQDHCIRHGLVNRTEGGSLQFLHRTFAEYLVAEYIFEGFKINEDRNELLDYTPAALFIFTDILGRNRYKEIRIFIDSMLHEIGVKKLIDESRSTSNPSGLQQFVLRFSFKDGAHWDDPSKDTYIPISFENKGMIKYALPSSIIKDGTFSKYLRLEIKTYSELLNNKGMISFALPSSMEEGNVNIFRLMWDCLVATNDKRDVQKIAYSLMAEKNHKIGSIDILQQLLQINEQTDMEAVVELIRKWSPFDLVDGLNDTEKKEAIKYMLEFMGRHELALMKVILLTRDSSHPFVKLMSSMMKREFLKERLTELLYMLSCKCRLLKGGQDIFLKLIEPTVKFEEDQSGQLRDGWENLFHSLGEIGRSDILEELFHLILRLAPKKFGVVYCPSQVKLSLTERDAYGMTEFHRAAAHNNDFEPLETEINEKGILRSQETKDRLVDCMTSYDEQRPSSFLVALCCENKEILVKMLTFLNQILPDEILILVKTSGFFGVVNFKLERETDIVQNFQLVLKTIKESLGKPALTELASDLCEDPQQRFPDFSKTYFLKAMIKNDGSHDDLADLLSQDERTLKLFKDIKDGKTVKDLIDLKGLQHWLDRCLAMGAEKFNWLSIALNDIATHPVKESKRIWLNHVNFKDLTIDSG